MPDTTVPAASWKGHVFCAGLIVGFAILLYANALQGVFIWDDKEFISGNAVYLSDWSNIIHAFTRPFYKDAPAFRPLLMVSYIIDFSLWGLNPFGYHLTNILLHAVCGVLVYALACSLFLNRFVALFSALLFVSHPVQTEAVAWIGGRNDLMLTLFVLAVLLSYHAWKRRCKPGDKAWLAVFTAACWGALLTKESGVVVLLLMGLTDCFFSVRHQKSVKEHTWPYTILLCSIVLFFIIRAQVLGNSGMGNFGEELWARMLTACGIYAYYFTILIWPVRLAFDPFVPFVQSAGDPALIGPLLGAVALGGVAVMCAGYFRSLLFVLLWIVISLLPVSGVVPLVFQVLEHRAHLAVAGFSFALPLIVCKVQARFGGVGSLKKSQRFLYMLPLVLAVALYSLKTAGRTTVWQSETGFWEQAILDSPRSVFSRINLAGLYTQQGRYSQAIAEYKAAIVLNDAPGRAVQSQRLYQKSFAYNHLGLLFYQALQKHARLSELDTVQRHEILALVGESSPTVLFEKSRAYFLQALDVYPRNAHALNNLGDLYFWNQEPGKALHQYRKAIEIDPLCAAAHINSGIVLLDKGDLAEAQACFEKAYAIKPSVAALNNLSLTYYRNALYEKALWGFSRALQLDSGNPEIHYNLALVFLKGFRNIEKGAYHLQKSLRFNPSPQREEEIKRLLTVLSTMQAR